MKSSKIKILMVTIFLMAFTSSMTASVRTITFTNKLDTAVNDLHIVFSKNNVNWDNNQPHTFDSERHNNSSKTHNFYGTTVEKGGSATLTFEVSEGDISIQQWWWTIGGTSTADGVREGPIKVDSSSNILAWSGNNASGNGAVAVSIGGINSVFYTTAGYSPAQTQASFISFINNNFNFGSSNLIYHTQSLSGNFVIAGNLLGNDSVSLKINIVSQDNSQPLKITPPKLLSLTSIIEGLYNAGINLSVSDVQSVTLRNSNSPHSSVDYTQSEMDSTANGTIMYLIPDGNYYIVINHRNSIETWSASPVNFNSGNIFYDFSVSQSSAFGNNLVLSGTKYCLFSGDVNQDGSVDVSDLVGVYNDANNFVSGYVGTDINGDGFVDVSDLVVTYNNALNFVSTIRP